VCSLAAAVCIALALPTTAGAVPAENVGHHARPQPSLATPTVVRETVIRPTERIDAAVLVATGVGVCVAMLAAGYLGARLATRGRYGTQLPS
jgi:hypothetical protein